MYNSLFQTRRGGGGFQSLTSTTPCRISSFSSSSPLSLTTPTPSVTSKSQTQMSPRLEPPSPSLCLLLHQLTCSLCGNKKINNKIQETRNQKTKKKRGPLVTHLITPLSNRKPSNLKLLARVTPPVVDHATNNIPPHRSLEVCAVDSTTTTTITNNNED